MFRCLVTGAAGFIGSHLCESLLRQGHQVTGIDCFTDYYSCEQKRENISKLRETPSFVLVDNDVLKIDLEKLLKAHDYVFHLAAQPGVRASWGESFDVYVRNNILATQVILEVAKKANLKRLVFASSSSIYGDAECFPTSEAVNPRPILPYGVSS